MPSSEPARYSEPFFLSIETGDNLEDALRLAVRENARSMHNLHDAITSCVASLRADGMTCEAMLLTMKACVHNSARKHQRNGSHTAEYSTFIIDQIVKWCIEDFFIPE